jgi:ribonuclease J
MTMTLTLTVHRATDQIGGNCIELRAGADRLVLDVGRPLDAPSNAKGLIPSTLDLTRPATILISHPHQDHYGLLDEAPADWPVWCGEPSRRLMTLTAGLTGRTLPQTFNPWPTGSRFEIGPFAVTPMLTDHSAFDAHMLLLEAHGRTVLYSGDFRRHGRKAALVDRLMAKPPKVDVLLMEGTNLGSDKPCVTEADLEERFVSLFRKTAGRVFVASSAQNIDRTVSLYRACLKTGRTLVVDLYTAEVMAMLAEFGRLPEPGWPRIKVVMTAGLRGRYASSEGNGFAEQMAKVGMSAATLESNPGRLVIVTRRSLVRDFVRKGVKPTQDDVWCWSQWRGYLDNPEGTAIKDWFEAGGARAEHIHTSGHASVSDLRAFSSAIGPKRLVPIHGVKWDEDHTGFPPITRLRDGEPLELP